jgi:hypothetical protein
MAWVSPKSWSVGEVVTAANLVIHLTNNTRYLKGMDGPVTIDNNLTSVGTLASSIAAGSIGLQLNEGARIHLGGSAGTLYNTPNAGAAFTPATILQARGDAFEVWSGNGLAWGIMRSGSLVLNTTLNVGTTGTFGTGVNVTAGQSRFAYNRAINSGSYNDAPIVVLGSSATFRAAIGFHTVGQSGLALYESGRNLRTVTDTGIDAIVWSAANDGSGSGLDADVIRGSAPGNGSGQVPLSNGSTCSNLNADMVDGFHASAFALLSGANFSGAIVTDNAQIRAGGGSGSSSRIRAEADGNGGDPTYHLGTSGDTGFVHSGFREIGFYTSGAQRGRVADSGVLHWNTNMEATSFNAYSDRRSKAGITPLGPGMTAKIKAMKPSRYTRTIPVYGKGARDAGRQPEQVEEVGLIAQEVPEEARVVIKAHGKKEDGTWHEDVPDDARTDGMGYSITAMLAILVAGFQELEGRLSAVEARPV